MTGLSIQLSQDTHMNDCNTLQHTETHTHPSTHCNTLQHTATHCNTLQHTATHCNTLQHTATHCNTLNGHVPQAILVHFISAHRKHTATHRNTPQHTATHCNTSQHTATDCNTPQHTATQHSSRGDSSPPYVHKRALYIHYQEFQYVCKRALVMCQYVSE